MGDEGPKLFSTRPKKSKLKSSTVASSPPPGAAAPHPSRSRYRVFVPLILGLNFAIGAYVLVKTALRNQSISEDQNPPTSTSNSNSNSTSTST